MTGIEWTDVVWNPTTGCDRVSPGCDHCYALTMAKRLKGMGQAKYQRDGDPRTSGPGFGITEHASALDAPLSWRKPRKVFVNSMSDLFHDGVSDAFIAEVFSVMARCPRHTFQVLTKRHGRMRSLISRPSFRDNLAHLAPWPLPNVWLGVSVEDQQRADLRVPALMQTPAAVRFLSCEPLLGPVELNHLHSHCPMHDFSGGFCSGPCPDRLWPDWVIVGGESGPGARPMPAVWPRRLRGQCERAGIPFFFKQWGEWTSIPPRRPLGPPDIWVSDDDGRTADEDSASAQGGSWTGVYRVGKRVAGRELDGRTWDEYPAAETASTR